MLCTLYNVKLQPSYICDMRNKDVFSEGVFLTIVIYEYPYKLHY